MFVSLNVSAQKEIYFSDKPRDSVSIVGVRGIQLTTLLTSTQTGVSFPVSIGYFNELKSGNTTSFILSANIGVTKAVISYKRILDSNGIYIGSDFTYGYGFQLNVKAESRLYFDYQKRYETGKTTKLNSGWFLGLPVEINTNPFTSYSPFGLNLKTGPSLGYRGALSNRLFIEGAIGGSLNLYSFHYLQLTPDFNLKLAYIFK